MADKIRQHLSETCQFVSMLDRVVTHTNRIMRRLMNVPKHWEVKHAKHLVGKDREAISNDLRLAERRLRILAERSRQRRLGR